MSDLFQRGPLQQETGLLKERWGQDGSNIFNIVDGGGASDDTLLTASAKKKLYVSQISYVTHDTSGTTVLRDGSGGDIIFTFSEATSDAPYTFIFNFNTPLVFEDSIYYDYGTLSVSNIMIQGWEE